MFLFYDFVTWKLDEIGLRQEVVENSNQAANIIEICHVEALAVLLLDGEQVELSIID
jgi:hypothetical protein